jgi:hypothetical protein
LTVSQHHNAERRFTGQAETELAGRIRQIHGLNGVVGIEYKFPDYSSPIDEPAMHACIFFARKKKCP